jgi:hypothetical protein
MSLFRSRQSGEFHNVGHRNSDLVTMVVAVNPQQPISHCVIPVPVITPPRRRPVVPSPSWMTTPMCH